MSNQTASPTYTIKQASDVTGLPSSTLRYYESIGIIDEIHRDVNSKQRVYTEEDLNMLTSIACLSAIGMSLDDMRRYLNNRTKGAAAAHEQVELLTSQQNRLLAKAKQLKIRQNYIALKVAYWQAAIDGDKTQQKLIAEQAETLAKQLKNNTKEE